MDSSKDSSGKGAGGRRRGEKKLVSKSTKSAFNSLLQEFEGTSRRAGMLSESAWEFSRI